MKSKKVIIMTKSKKLPPIHPGEMLREEFLVPYQISPEQLAQDISVSVREVKQICQEKKGISPDIATRLAVYFDMSVEFWLNCQKHYELRCSEKEIKQIKKEVRPFALRPFN